MGVPLGSFQSPVPFVISERIDTKSYFAKKSGTAGTKWDELFLLSHTCIV